MFVREFHLGILDVYKYKTAVASVQIDNVRTKDYNKIFLDSLQIQTDGKELSAKNKLINNGEMSMPCQICKNII